MSAIHFFEKSVDGRLSKDNLLIMDERQVELKLSVLNSLMKLPWTARMMGDYNGRGDYLYTEKIYGHTKGCMGFIKGGSLSCLIPNTVLAGDVRQYTVSPTKQI